MKLVYVASRFTADTSWDIAENVRFAERMALGVARVPGCWPVNPLANTQLFFDVVDPQAAYDGTLRMLEACDAVVVCDFPGASRGVAREIEHAHLVGIPVFDARQLTAARAIEKLAQWVKEEGDRP